MKVCFAGSGSIGKRHINNLQKICKEKGISLETVLFRSTNSPLDGISFDKQVFSVEELGEDYDMIFITNPTFLHFDTLKMLHDKSDYFFVEKPVFDSTNLDYSFVARNKLIYVACPLRHLGVIRNIGKYVDLEKVFSVRSICSTYLPDWRPGIDYRKNYSAHADAGGGVRIDLIHEWDYLTALLGFPDKVYSISSTISELEIDSEDIAVYIAQDKKRTIELHLDYFGRLPRRQCELFTNDYVYTVDLINSIIKRNNDIIYEEKEEPNDKYIREMEYFLELVSGKVENINDIDNAVRVMRLAAM